MPQMVAPPGAPYMAGQVNGLPRPPTESPLTAVPGSSGMPTSSSAALMVTPAMYQVQANPAAPASRSMDGFNTNGQAAEANH